MVPLRKTLYWTVGTAVVLFFLISAAGVAFLTSHKNKIAEDIVYQHTATVVWLFARILVGYVLVGLLVGLVLHPFAKGWKSAPAMLGLGVLAFIHTLTDETHLLYGPVQEIFCSVHDALPTWLIRAYEPWLIEAAFGLLLFWSLWRWTRRVALRWKAGVGVAAALAIGVGFLPPARAQGTRPVCFVLIASDSLRADHLSCNGYARDTSPHIDALAARGTNFANCLVPTASTHESWVTMFSSTEPRVSGLRHMFPTRGQVEAIVKREKWFPGLLKAHGYQTGVIGGWCGTTFSLFDTGFDHVDVSRSQNHLALIAEAAFTDHLLAASFLDNPVGRLLIPELNRVSFTRGSSALTRKAKEFLDHAAQSDKPFFLTVVYHVTHLPYSASYPYYTRFTDPDYRGNNRYRIDFQIDEMIQRGFEHDLSDEDLRHIVDLYDGCVNEFDAQVGAIVAELEELGLLENTIVGVLGDHGDDLYEHGTTLGHGVTLFGGDHANHIPAVFAGPGVAKRSVQKLVRSYDLAPTWATWLKVPRPARWQGVDLSADVPDLSVLLETSYLLYRQPVPDLRPGEAVKGFPRFDDATFLDPTFDHNLVLREKYNDAVIATKCFAVREGKWKLIRVPGEDGFLYRLFDLASDPECRKDLAGRRPEIFRRLQRQLPDADS